MKFTFSTIKQLINQRVKSKFKLYGSLQKEEKKYFFNEIIFDNFLDLNRLAILISRFSRVSSQNRYFVTKPIS